MSEAPGPETVYSRKDHMAAVVEWEGCDREAERKAAEESP